MVVDGILSGRYTGHFDEHFFPVAYLYRHYLELKMKDVLKDGIRTGLIEVDPKVMTGHNLHRLWVKFRQLVVTMKMGSDPEPLDRTERVVLDFHQLDATGQVFRYPRSKDGTPHLTNAPWAVGFENMRRVVAEAAELLGGCESCMHRFLDGLQ